ncbi:Translocation protein SEC62 [Intoshia linei]|uniref:Translocation protein SEC62 n=1 Tax=Intoshia linei TaxID=1819745 RepID=A0A177BCN4_9BILA|nr:Translocation protein SEC62 [Intoshia linei]
MKEKKKNSTDEGPQHSAEDLELINYLYNNVTIKSGKCLDTYVDYFTSEDAIDTFSNSKKHKAQFDSKIEIITVCQHLLELDFFHRAQRFLKTKKSTPAKTKQNVFPTAKKLKLEPHEQNVFLDGDNVYIFTYEPRSIKKFLIGCLFVVGTVAVCMYPLWPETGKTGAYYISLLLGIFVAVILFLSVFRYILWILIYAVTYGKLDFFLFPNLTEDVGFIDSFIPLYIIKRPKKKKKL